MTRDSSRRREAAVEEVDYLNLASLVRRRCVGCALDYHLAIAQRFLSQNGFSPQDIQKVQDILARHSPRRPLHNARGNCSMNGSVICDHCRQRMSDHPRDPENPEQVVACNGKKIRLCL